MIAQSQLLLRVASASILALLLTSPARGTSWGPREDVGVAAVDTRTGKVLWEAWRLEEVPADVLQEEKAAVEYLLAVIEDPSMPVPRPSSLPEVPVKGLVEKSPWPHGVDEPGPTASRGKSLIYYRHARGVVAFDRQTKKEVWRLLTMRYPYPSLVLEAGENRAYVQIGSDVPVTIHATLVGGGPGPQKMPNLGPYTLEQRAAAAVLLHRYGDGYLRPKVREIVELLRAENGAPAVKSVEKLLAEWPQKRNRQRMLEGCVAALLPSDERDPFREFAWPGTLRVLAWCLLQELIYGSPRDGYTRQGYNYAYDGWKEQPVSLPDATRDKLVDHCRRVVAEGPDAEKPFAASVLVSSAVGWGNLTDAERKTLFLSSNPSAWRWAALALAKNGRRKQLVEWARERPDADHLDVIWVLKHDKPEELSDAELAFWLACAKRNAGGVAHVLRSCGGSHPIAFRAPIRKYLEQEIAEPTVKEGGKRAAYWLSAALEVLDAWKHSDDTPLLREYLKHPLHHTASGSAGTVVRRYALRSRVQRMLEERGAQIPPGVVYEEEIPTGEK